ncbi:Uncharacterized protein HZ326_18947 [Fusarium oxysporum f. sp. albedinis]|nr:Uncharacterized protein HZ326_21312 [Fusarium oxysporum f. sp. albedinis]KAJ0138084.1 Uncharacterized protein HZ326_18947 [Fusarium oxysporum f. sp. albedinis]
MELSGRMLHACRRLIYNHPLETPHTLYGKPKRSVMVKGSLLASQESVEMANTCLDHESICNDPLPLGITL